MIVRDHILNDPAYHWSDVAEELPYGITQAMYFKPPPEIKVIVNDLSTTFTQPASYIPYMTGMAVYARDKWDTPVSGIRRVDEEEMKRYTAISQKAMMKLYKRISGMSKRDRITCGVTNYVVDWALPFLRLSGTYDKAIERGWLEWDPMTSESYYPLVRDGQAGPLLPEAIIAGKGAQSLQPSSGEEIERAGDQSSARFISSTPAACSSRWTSIASAQADASKYDARLPSACTSISFLLIPSASGDRSQSRRARL